MVCIEITITSKLAGLYNHKFSLFREECVVWKEPVWSQLFWTVESTSPEDEQSISLEWNFKTAPAVVFAQISCL